MSSRLQHTAESTENHWPRKADDVGAQLAQAANTHSHPPTCIISLSLLCRHTDTANLIARLSPRVSFSTGAFQLLPEPASIYWGREEAAGPGRASSFITKLQTAWQRTNTWLIGFHLLLCLLTQSSERQDQRPYGRTAWSTDSTRRPEPALVLLFALHQYAREDLLCLSFIGDMCLNNNAFKGFQMNNCSCFR